MANPDPIWTNHAATRVLERGLNGPGIQQRAADAIAVGIGRDKPQKIWYGKVGIVVHENRIITVMVQNGSRSRRNVRGKRRRGRA